MLADWFVACSTSWEMTAMTTRDSQESSFSMNARRVCSAVCTSASAPPQNGPLDCAQRHMGALFEATSIKPRN